MAERGLGKGRGCGGKRGTSQSMSRPRAPCHIARLQRTSVALAATQPLLNHPDCSDNMAEGSTSLPHANPPQGTSAATDKPSFRYFRPPASQQPRSVSVSLPPSIRRCLTTLCHPCLLYRYFRSSNSSQANSQRATLSTPPPMSAPNRPRSSPVVMHSTTHH